MRLRTSRQIESTLLGLLVVAGTVLATVGAAEAAPVKKPAAPRLVKLAVSPPVTSLAGPEARQTLVVTGLYSDGSQRDLTEQARLSVSNPKVAMVDGEKVAHAVGDGKATVKASVGTVAATASLEVKGAKQPFVWSFRNHVTSVFSKQGCNAGACHGAAAGKGGFRLTLRGYDPDLDFQRLLREGGGRRVVKTDPGRSLVLMKPSMAVAHQGGLRLRPGTREYRVVSEWIAAGMPGPAENDSRIVSLEVLPKQRQLSKGQEQRLVVQAKFSDGRVEDVTRWARYTSNEEGVAKVDEHGVVKTEGYGETAVAVFYLDKVNFTTVTVPFPNQLSPARYAKLKRHNYVDDLVIKKLAGLRLWPSEVAPDAEFFRRIHVDLIGVLPTADEVRAFLADRDAEKRVKLVDRLMERPEFVDLWTYKWSDLLRVSRESLTDQGMWAFYEWIREQVAKNRPWNEVVHEVLTSTGSNFEDGPSNFYRIARTPEDLGETASQAFLGIRVQCAKCHNHPFEKWTQNDYYQMANFFARVGRKNGDAANDLIIYPQPSGNVNHPKLGKPLPPRPYDGQPMELDAPGDRREFLATWLTAPANPYFARSIVNRVWRHFMARGLIEPVDDLRATNPATNEALMAALVKDLVDHKFDLRHLMRQIVTSRTYWLTSRPNDQNRKDDRHYSRYFVRRLTAEQLLDAICQVTGQPEKFAGFPAGTRATQLPDTRVGSYFLDVFGRPPRQITCDCERAQEPNMAQALHLINGPGVNQKISAQGGLVDRLLAAKKQDAEIIEELYLTCFGRLPDGLERKATLEAVNEAVNPPPGPMDLGKTAPAGTVAGAVPRTKPATPKPEAAKPAESKPAEPAKAAAQPNVEQARKLVFEDLLWALINGKEFIFNH